MVKQWQDLIYSGRHSQTYMNSLPDFVKLAESYGHVGIQISTPDELESKLQEAFSIKINWSLLILMLMKPNTFTQCKFAAGR